MTPVLAHAGHWAPQLAIYLGPVVVVGLGLWLSGRRDRRRDRR
jgi:hypothetical protein